MSQLKQNVDFNSAYLFSKIAIIRLRVFSVYTQDVLARNSLCLTGWTTLIQNKRKHHNIKISIFFLKYFNTLQMSNSHSKSENVKLFGQNLQLISSLQKLPPVIVNKLFHCLKSCWRHDLIFIQWFNFEEIRIHTLTVYYYGFFKVN